MGELFANLIVKWGGKVWIVADKIEWILNDVKIGIKLGQAKCFNCFVHWAGQVNVAPPSETTLLKYSAWVNLHPIHKEETNNITFNDPVAGKKKKKNKV